MVNRYSNSGSFRYGFNGKEKDNEDYGEGNIYDYGKRIFNPRLGRFLSTDPIASQFAFYSPYQYAGNKPIWATDLDGAEELVWPRWWWTVPEISLPRVPVQPLPPIIPAIPGSFSIPQAPTLPPGPFMPVQPIIPSLNRTTQIDESKIDPFDASTWPQPPKELGEGWQVKPVKKGDKGYDKLKDKEATRLEDDKGGVLRWHRPDKYHPKGHWDYKNPDINRPMGKWENYTPDGQKIPEGSIYGKDFNPPPASEQTNSLFSIESIRKLIEQYSNKKEYEKKLQQYQKDLQKYKKEKEDYNKKVQEYNNEHPEIKG